MKKNTYFLIFVVILISSCEYRLEETNYREIEPPSGYVTLEINLNNINPLDTIYILVPTKLICTLNTEQGKILQVDIRINDISIPIVDFSQSNISFIVDPDRIGYGKYELKMDCVTSSGSGSLADLMGFEGYGFEAFWNVKVVKYSDYFTSGYRISKDGQIELYWDNPMISDDLIISCELFHYFEDGAFEYSEELDPLKKSVIINDYVCGKSIYTVRTSFKLDNLGYSYPQEFSYNGEIVIDTPIPEVHIEDLNENKLRLYWNKPIVAGAKFNVQYGQREYFKNEILNFTDTTVVVSKPQVGSYFECKVDFYPKEPKYPRASASSEASFLYGKKVGFGSNDVFIYNSIENVAYTVKDDSIAVVDLNSLDTRYVKTEIYVFEYITCPNSSKFAVIGFDKTIVYNDSKLISPTILNTQWQTNVSYVLSNDYLFEFTETASNIYDLTTGLKIKTLPALGFQVKMSIDGRYFACRNFFEIGFVHVYTFNDFNFMKKGTPIPGASGYDTYHFHPTNLDQIIIEGSGSYRSSFNFYNLSRFEIVKSAELPTNFRFLNFDPITECVIYNSGSIIGIASLSNLSKQLYSTHGYQGNFYNGCLFYKGYAADIKKELLQP